MSRHSKSRSRRNEEEASTPRPGAGRPIVNINTRRLLDQIEGISSEDIGGFGTSPIPPEEETPPKRKSKK